MAKLTDRNVESALSEFSSAQYALPVHVAWLPQRGDFLGSATAVDMAGRFRRSVTLPTLSDWNRACRLPAPHLPGSEKPKQKTPARTVAVSMRCHSSGTAV
jgi:hypothetical protein